VYPGADGSFEHVEDDGWSTDYEKGAVTRWTVAYDDARAVLSLTRSGPGHSGPAGASTFEIVLHGQETDAGILVNGQTAHGSDTGHSSYDAATRTVRVVLSDVTRRDDWRLEFPAGNNACSTPAALVTASIAPWLNVSRPTRSSAWVDAFVPSRSAGEASESVTLHPPIGWTQSGDPVALTTGDGATSAMRWALEAIGPQYEGASEVVVAGTGVPPIVAHLTSECLGQWQILGLVPFDDGDLLDTSGAPEQALDLRATYPGRNGESVGWRKCSVLDCTGYVNLVGFLENSYGPIPSGDYKVMKRLAYCATWIHSGDARTIDLELEGEDRFKVWINGTLALTTAGPSYAPGVRMSAALHEGWNRVLVKAVQDGGREWGGRRWGFYLRPAGTESMHGVRLCSTADEPQQTD
jgi:hypothetical protein